MDARQVFTEYTDVVKIPTNVGSYCHNCGYHYLGNELGAEEQSRRCPQCDTVEYFNPLPAVSVLVSKDNSVLLARRTSQTIGSGEWCLPAGFIEWGESFLDAAKREVHEETGLAIKVNSVISVVTNFFSPKLHSLVIVIHATEVGGTLLAGDDADRVAWYEFDAGLPKLAFAADAHIIQRFFSDQSLGVPVDNRYN